jgi:hypothetical protein
MKRFLPVFAGILLPFAAFAAQEGTPNYYKSGYQPAQATQTAGGNTVIGTRSYSYQVPRATAQNQYMPGTGNYAPGTAPYAMTPGGIGMPTQPDWLLSADYTRRFASFEFKTGVNSILKWDDMLINEIGVRLDHNFTVKDYNLFVMGEYRYGTVSGGGPLSYDYDLEPYDWSQPNVGIFTVSMGDQSGKTDYIRLGFGAKNIWDIAGWKFSPSIGYEIFHHNLEMSNHIYPNPGIYLPLLTDRGDYVFGNDAGEYYNIPQGVAPPDDLYQVCLSPEDIMVAVTNPDGSVNLDAGFINTINWQNSISYGTYIPWGVGPGECVIIGGDGPIIVKGVTHIYNTTWSGIYLGLEIEKQMTFADKLRFYVQLGMPEYSSEGIWPNRTDWQQNPSFIDKGGNGAYSYQAEMEYTYQVSERMQLSIKADTNYFYVGKIGGELYIAGYTTYAMTDDGQYIFHDPGGIACDPYLVANCYPQLVTVDPHTVKINDSLKYAKWQSFGLHIGVKYAF